MKQLIYGMHAVKAALENPRLTIEQLWVVQPYQGHKLDSLITLAQAKHIAVQFMSRSDLDAQLPDVTHQGIAVQIQANTPTYDENDIYQWIEAADAAHPVLLLILDGVQDPHNLGACLRTADAAGVSAVIAPKDKAVSLTPVVRKVACGAAESIPFVQVTNLARFIRQIKQQGVWCYGLAGAADKTLYQADLRGPVALLLGAEGSGLRQLTQELCDELLSIPMAGSVASVNVSVATGISLFEVVRQRLFPGGDKK